MNSFVAERTERHLLATQVANATRFTPSNQKTINGRRAFSTMQAARFLGNVDAVTLVRWQQSKEANAPPHFEQFGQILYLEDDLKEWRKRPSTAEPTVK